MQLQWLSDQVIDQTGINWDVHNFLGCETCFTFQTHTPFSHHITWASPILVTRPMSRWVDMYIQTSVYKGLKCKGEILCRRIAASSEGSKVILDQSRGAKNVCGEKIQF